MKQAIRIGVDVGGTFTDVVYMSENDEPRILKVPSTPDDPARGVLDAVESLLGIDSARSKDVITLAHGTTVATNAVLERKGASVGLIATEGFTDVLEIGRQMRRQMYAVRLDPETPVFVAPGYMRQGVCERIGAAGEVVTPLDERSVERALDVLVDRGAQAFAVSLLFSFLNPSHEKRIREIAQARHPGLTVSLSSDVDPAFREYERTAVTAFDAYIKPVVSGYLERLHGALTAAGVGAPLQVMQSRGGLANAHVASRRPVRLFLSGPAAGVLGARAVGDAAGEPDLITVDIGGTSCDIALVSDAKPLIRAEGIIDGYTVRVPMLDVNAIGAGGGSIAWIDAAGSLRVGPQSAGAAPGPACYGRGGQAPTVTDASVILGLLDPGYFAGGDLTLDAERAHRAVATQIAQPLLLDVEAAAAGIHRVVNAQMAEGIRLVSIRQGFDPRDFALVPLGGAGPLHACALADELHIGRIVVPRHPGVLSASGLLAAPVEHDASAAFGERLAGLDPAAVRAKLEELDRRCESLMALEGELGANRTVEYYADVCYMGQAYHLEVPLAVEPHGTGARSDAFSDLYDRFLALHDRVYGYAVDGAVKIVNLRSVHRAGGGALASASSTGPSSRARSHRTIRLPDVAGRIEALVLSRDALSAGQRIEGPAIVEQADSTLLIAPQWIGEVHPDGLLRLSRVGVQE
ncbi:MAG: hydantoinase/oxoprolinase family protein [Gammaproteobacteria bacterium]